MSDMGALAGRVVVVTGAAGGIGRAIVDDALAEGATVAAVDQAEPPPIDDPAGRLTVHVVDLADRSAIRTFVEGIGARHGRIDGLVNCAAVRFTGSVDAHTDDMWDRTIAVNLTAAFALVRDAYQLLVVSGRASVVNIGSVVGEMARSDAVAYCTAKSGLHGMTRALAADLGPHGVRVNTVVPSFVATPMTAPRLRDEQNAQRMRAAHVLGRWAEGYEIAAAVTFLLSDRAGFVTGIELPVDGGWLSTKAL